MIGPSKISMSKKVLLDMVLLVREYSSYLRVLINVNIK